MLTLFDISMLAILTLSIFFGVFSGFIATVINLMSFILSIFGAIFLHNYLKDILSLYILGDSVVIIVSLIISYSLSSIIFGLIAAKVKLLLSALDGVLNKLLGLFFGAIRGIMIVTMIFGLNIIFFTGSYIKAKENNDSFHGMVKYLTISKYPDWIKESWSFNYLDNIVKYSIKLLPDFDLSSDSLDMDNFEMMHEKDKDNNQYNNAIYDTKLDIEDLNHVI